MGADANITALAPWFGGKRTLAPEIVRELGDHRAYWEPFCGSMAVLLAKPQCSMETVNDLHGDLVNLARVVQDEREGPRLYRRLRRTAFSDELYADSAAIVRKHPFKSGGERAYHYFLVSWGGRNGVAGSTSGSPNFCLRFTNKGGHAAKRFASAVDSIPAWRRRLRNVTILSRDGIEIIERIEDADGTAIYVDPPYFAKGAKYVHDFASEDHDRLADALRRFRKTRVVLSYYDHPRLGELYPTWTATPLKATKAMVNQGMRDRGGSTAAPEVLLVNGESRLGGTIKSEAAAGPLFAGA